MAKQLTFDLPVRTSLERGDYFVSDANAFAVARLDAVESWTSHKMALVGPKGSGKTHLAHVWAEATGGAVMALTDMQAADVVHVNTPLAVEISDSFEPETENTLFHLHNHMAAVLLPFLMITRAPPARWPLVLPDLKSRMDATELVQIGPPDDALLAAVLVKQFADRQLHVAPSLIAWMTKRMDRSFAEAQRLVAECDAAALAQGRPINRTLAQHILDNAPNSTP